MHFVFDKITHDQTSKSNFAEGEEEEVIKAAMMLRDEHYGSPILIGRHSKIDPIVQALEGEGYSLENITVMNAAINNNLSQYIDYLYKSYNARGIYIEIVQDLLNLIGIFCCLYDGLPRC